MDVVEALRMGFGSTRVAEAGHSVQESLVIGGFWGSGRRKCLVGGVRAQYDRGSRSGLFGRVWGDFQTVLLTVSNASVTFDAEWIGLKGTPAY